MPHAMLINVTQCNTVCENSQVLWYCLIFHLTAHLVTESSRCETLIASQQTSNVSTTAHHRYRPVSQCHSAVTQEKTNSSLMFTVTMSMH